MWKVLSGIIAIKFHDHKSQYISAKKGIGNNTRGSKQQLLRDKAVVLDKNKI